MSTNKEKILEKLRKLMNLKESATVLGNEGEANAAAAGIARLLMEYNLTEDDIPEQERIDNPVVMEEIPYRVAMSSGSWYEELISTVCHYNLCRSLIVSTYKKCRMSRDAFQIIGRKKNVEVVLYLISFLSHQFVVVGKRGYPTYRWNCIYNHGVTPKAESVFLKSFLRGCVIGLNAKFQEMKNDIGQTDNVTALIVTAKSEIDDFLKDREIGKSRPSKESVDSMAAKSGYKVGKSIEINKGLYAETVREEMRLK